MSSRIIIRAPNWIGDAVMAVPMIQCARRTFPEVQLTVLARDWVSQVYAFVDGIDETISFPKGQAKNQHSTATLIPELRERRFDLGFLLPDSFSSAWMLYRSKVVSRVGYEGQWRGWMLTKRLDPYSSRRLHRTDKYLRLLEGYTAEIPFGVSPRLSVGTSKQLPAPEGWDKDSMRIGLNPHSVASSRRWLLPYWRDLINKLNDPSVQFVVFGSSDIIQYSNELTEGLEANILNLAGRLRLSESIYHMSRCSLFISNDSGPMHIADGLGVPTIGIFGAGDCTLTGLRSPHSENLNANVYCSPCEKNRCTNKRESLICMQKLSPEQVASVAHGMLGKQ